jgi:hypothetical protein
MRHGALLASRSVSAILLAMAAAVAANPALAAVDFSAGASVGAQYDSNARQLSSSELPPLVDGERAERSDVSLNASANVAARIDSQGPLTARFQMTYGHSESLQQDTLSSDNYSFGVGVDWKPSGVFDMSLEGSQNRLPLGFADIGGIESTPQTTTTVNGALRLRPIARWQLSLTPGWSESVTALDGAEDLRLRTTSAGVAIDYLGGGRFVPGIGASQSESVYSGVDNATRYKQQSVFGAFSYRFNEITSLAVSAGHTWRTTRLREPSSDPAVAEFAGKDTAFTGSLNLSRRLTAKTSINLSIFRGFQVYDAGVNTSVGTGFSAGVSWAATSRISTSLTVSQTWSTIDNIVVGGSRVQREDLVRNYSLGASYRASRLVSVNANVSRYVRSSEIDSDQYNGMTAGLSLSVQFD